MFDWKPLDRTLKHVFVYENSEPNDLQVSNSCFLFFVIVGSDEEGSMPTFCLGILVSF